MFEKTWRWFGRNDLISLEQIRQIGIEGIVTALHHITNGTIWPEEEILLVKKMIEEHGMNWSVVESLPVHEEIKYGGQGRDMLISNYNASLENLGKCGIKNICYNFMPVIDWIRTDLTHKLPDNSEVLYFSFLDFIVFDLFILKRKNAEKDYTKEQLQEVSHHYELMTDADIRELVDTIIVKTQGFIDGISAANTHDAILLFKERLQLYEGIDEDRLRENLFYFLNAILPTAEKYGIKMSIHADDPPRKMLGLPRIVGSAEDIGSIFDAVPSTSNGLTFCAGSLSAGPQNNVVEIAKQFADRIHFVHLRSTQLLENGDFYEAGHLEGSVDMFSLIEVLLEEQKRRGEGYKFPMRVDHGAKLLNDFNESYNPGYPLIGRLKAMSEITGMATAVERMFNT